MLTRVEYGCRALKEQFEQSPHAVLRPAEVCTAAGLDEATCRRVLTALAEVRFLREGPAGAFRRGNIVD